MEPNDSTGNGIVASHWNEFLRDFRNAVTKDPSPAQIHTMKLCFYQGAGIMMRLMYELDENGAETLGRMREELAQYFGQFEEEEPEWVESAGSDFEERERERQKRTFNQ